MLAICRKQAYGHDQVTGVTARYGPYTGADTGADTGAGAGADTGAGTRPLGKRQRCAREAAQNSAPTLASAPNLALRRPWPLRRPHVLIRGLASQTASQWLRASVGTARPARTDQAGPDRPGQTRQAQAGPGRPGAGSHTFTATKNKDNSYRKKASEPQAQKRKHNI